MHELLKFVGSRRTTGADGCRQHEQGRQRPTAKALPFATAGEGPAGPCVCLSAQRPWASAALHAMPAPVHTRCARARYAGPGAYPLRARSRPPECKPAAAV